MKFIPRPTFFIALIAISLLSFGSNSAHSQEHSQVILGSWDIRDDGENIVELNELNLADFPLQESAELDAGNLSKLLEQLLANTNRYTHATATMTPQSDGVLEGEETIRAHLLIELQRERRVRAVRILAAFDDNFEHDLLDVIRTQRNRSVYGPQVQRDVETLEKYYWEKGYPEVEVEVSINQLREGDDDVVVTFELSSPTRQVRIRSLDIDIVDEQIDLSEQEMRDIKKGIEEISAYRPRSFFLQQRPVFNRGLLDSDKRDIERYLISEGFDSVDIETVYERSSNLVNVYYRVELGERKMVERISYQSDSDSDMERFRDDFGQAPLQAGQAYSDEVFRQNFEYIRQIFAQRGYLFNRVLGGYDSETEEAYFTISEGPMFKADRIDIEGLEQYDKDRARLALEIETGRIVTKDMITSQLIRLEETGLYAAVDVEIVVDEQEKREEGVITGALIFHVQESREQTLSFSLGASSHGPTGQVSYGRGHLGSTGASFNIFGQISEELKRVGIVFQDPHVGGSEWSGLYMTDAQESRTEFAESQRIRFQALFEKQVAQNLSMGVGARVEYVRSDLLHHYSEPQKLELRQKNIIRGLLGTLTYANIESDATGSSASGTQVRAVLMPSYAEQGAYARAVAEAVHHIELGRNRWDSSHTISGRLLVGAATSRAPEIERFRGGGVATLRGHQTDSLTTASGGGLGLVSANVTYSFPVYRDRLKGVLFLETASVSESIDNWGSFRIVGGFGVRANLGQSLFAPQIEAGVAYSLNSRSGDALRPFYIIFGDYDPRFDL